MRRLGERRAAEFEAAGSSEAGFTLIELMVVLLILAILLAIAIPTFLGVTGSANDRSAQSNLNTALTNAKSIYQQSGQVYPTTAANLAGSIISYEPSLPMTTATSVTTGQIAAVTDATITNGAVLFSLAKKTNECWWVADNTGSMAGAAVPWLSTALPVPTTIPAKETAGGVPVVAGIVYGVYKATATTCNIATLGVTTTLSTVSSTAFPPAP
jgi:type IV pilus assembly protein PilA